MLLQSTNGVGDALNKGKDIITENTKAMEGLGRATQASDIDMSKLAKSMLQLTLPVTLFDQVDKLRELTYDMTRESLGQTKFVGDAIAASIGEATFNTLQFGVGLDDNLKLMASINEKMQTNTLLGGKQIENMQLLAHNAGVAGADIAEIVVGFRNIGVGTDKAIENIGRMQKDARDYGVNVGTFMKGISSNLKMLSSYNFKDGVEGFSRMVMKAQALRIDVGKTFTMAEGLLEPEKAIEMAANFQMLGGAIGDLGDPFKLLHMAQTDAEGLQDAVIGMAESAVVFNEETGEFDIPVTEMYRLKEAAGAANMSYQEMTDMAFKAAERTKKLDLLGTTTVPEDYKELVANMGNIKGGQVEVSIPSFDAAGKQIATVTKKAHELNQTDYDALKKMNEESQMDEKSIALASKGYLETIANAVASAEAAPLMLGVQTKGITDMQETAKAIADTGLKGLEEAFTTEAVADYGSALTRHIALGMNDEEATQHFQSTASLFRATLQSQYGDAIYDAQKGMDDNNILKKMDIVDTVMGKVDSFTTALGNMNDELLGILPEDVQEKIKKGTLSLTENMEAIGQAMEYVYGRVNDRLMSTGQETGQNVQRGTFVHDEEDFILRPGEDPISFRKDDLILGGTKLFDAVNSINGMGGDIGMGGDNSMSGNVKLDVGGRIDLSVDGRNLPQNISSEQLAMEIVNNPDFTSKLMSIFTDSNNTYSA